MKIRQKWVFSVVLASSLGVALPGHAQEPGQPGEPPSSGWRKFGEPPAADTLPPSNLSVPAGTWITVRVDQPLSSDRNQQGDAFTAILAQPVIADGRVVARRGQTVGGVVAEAEKAGRLKGTSRLGLELTELGLVDGRQVPVKTRLMERRGDTSVGRDAGAIGTTTGIGAAIGAAADGGFGAGMGAIAGAAASAIGVLVTRGKATMVYPEDLLTFRLEAPLNISTENSATAFQPVTQEDYAQRSELRQPPPPERSPAPYPYFYPPYFYGGYPPYFYGPSFFFYSGARFHRGGFRRW